MADVEQRLFELTQQFSQHEIEQEEKFDRLVIAQQNNTDAIAEVTRSLAKLIADTNAIVRLHRDFQGAARVGAGLQGFMLWCLKWGAIGTGVVAIITWLVEHFSKHT